MGKSLVEMAAEIVQSQCCTNSMSNEEISDSLVKTFETLSRLSTGSVNVEEAAAVKSAEDAEVASAQGAVQAKEPAAGKAAVKKKKPRAKNAAVTLSPEESIQQDQIICLECGKSFKILSSRHLNTHGLSSRDYRKKYGFSLRQPLCSKTLSEKRKKAGEERGAPENLLKAIAKRKKAGKAKK